MPKNKVIGSFEEAVADIPDGASVMFGGFADCGIPRNLIGALVKKGARNLTIISNSMGYPEHDTPAVGHLIKAGQVKKGIVSFTLMPNRSFPELERRYAAGEIEIELVPQGTLAERIRAGGAGIGGFLTRTGVGTVAAKGKETMVLNDKEYILEMPLTADYAFIKAFKADTMGNLVYRRTTRNYNPIMATAARITIAEVEEIVQPGEMDPEIIGTPCIYVDRVIAQRS